MITDNEIKQTREHSWYVWNKNWVILWTSGVEKDDIGNKGR